MTELHLFLVSVLAVLGACIGSFLNVVIYRLPQEISINRPKRSLCPICSHTLAWYDNIPILAYFYLGGQCRYCGTPYGVRYPLVETLTAVLFALVGYRFGISPATGVYVVFVSLLIAIAFIDLDHFIIPTELIFIGLGLGFVSLLLAWLWPVWGERMLCVSWLHALAGAAGGFLLLWIVRFIASVCVGKEAMGLGDLNLIALFGLFFGWHSLLLIVLLSSFLGAVTGTIIKHRQKLQRYAEIPFGPFLVAAALIYLLFGQEIVYALWGSTGMLEGLGFRYAPLHLWPGLELGGLPIATAPDLFSLK